MRVETRVGVLAILFLIVTCVFWLVVAETTAAEIHSAKPTISPTVLNHQSLSWGSCRCPMCLGQHLRNYHGQAADRLDAVGFRNWSRYHRELHRTGVYKAPKPRPGCAGGVCPPRRLRLGSRYPLLRRWRR